ncbi:MAG: hypothetical protein WAL36_09045, partial [Pseudolabrys sp.]
MQLRFAGGDSAFHDKLGQLCDATGVTIVRSITFCVRLCLNTVPLKGYLIRNDCVPAAYPQSTPALHSGRGKSKACVGFAAQFGSGDLHD